MKFSAYQICSTLPYSAPLLPSTLLFITSHPLVLLHVHWIPTKDQKCMCYACPFDRPGRTEPGRVCNISYKSNILPLLLDQNAPFPQRPQLCLQSHIPLGRPLITRPTTLRIPGDLTKPLSFSTALPDTPHSGITGCRRCPATTE